MRDCVRTIVGEGAWRRISIMLVSEIEHNLALALRPVRRGTVLIQNCFALRLPPQIPQEERSYSRLHELAIRSASGSRPMSRPMVPGAALGIQEAEQILQRFCVRGVSQERALAFHGNESLVL